MLVSATIVEGPHLLRHAVEVVGSEGVDEAHHERGYVRGGRVHPPLPDAGYIADGVGDDANSKTGPVSQAETPHLGEADDRPNDCAEDSQDGPRPDDPLPDGVYPLDSFHGASDMKDRMSPVSVSRLPCIFAMSRPC